jgi:hypothetical protein
MNDAALRELPNPAARHDYLVRLDGAVGAGARLTLHYVPDRSIADATEFDAYLLALRTAPRATPEALAARVLEDVNNALVPRWVRVTVTGANHTVLIEDSQPDWENDALISALAPL